MDLPNELWEYILEFIRDFPTLYSICQTSRNLWDRLHTMNHYKYIRNKTEQLAYSHAKNWACKRAILEHRCQLCKKTYSFGFVQPKWGLYAHGTCIHREVITIPRAIEIYDISFEQLIKLPRQDNSVWKYHGGRTWLPFSVLSTIQGLCLRTYMENLHDRRNRMGILREKAKQENKEDMKISAPLKRKYDQICESDRKSNKSLQ